MKKTYMAPEFQRIKISLKTDALLDSKFKPEETIVEETVIEDGF